MKEINFYNDESRWYPQLERNDSLKLINILNELINSQPDRQKKREFNHKLLTKNGEARPGVIANFKYISPHLIKKIMDNYPLTLDEAASCINELFKNDSEVEVWEFLENSFADISRLPQWYEMQWDRVIPISSFLRDIGTSLQSSTDQLFLASKLSYERYRTLEWDEKEISRKMNDTFSGVKDSIPIGLVLKMAEKLNLKIYPEKLSWLTAPSLLTATTISYHIAKKCLFTGGTSRAFKTSDFGDISHTFHIPHVDIFRADAFIASVLKEAKLPFNTSIVGNLNDLLDVVNERLKERYL